MDDEINIKEDITEIVEYIKWESVSMNLLFEFIIKYGKNISNEDIEHIFFQAFDTITKATLTNTSYSSTNNNSSAVSQLKEDTKFFSKCVMEELISMYIHYIMFNRGIKKDKLS